MIQNREDLDKIEQEYIKLVEETINFLNSQNHDDSRAFIFDEMIISSYDCQSDIVGISPRGMILSDNSDKGYSIIPFDYLEYPDLSYLCGKIIRQNYEVIYIEKLEEYI